MDAVDRFEITFDLESHDVLYDYVQCEKHRRPDGGQWDLSVFRGSANLDCVEEDDENSQLRVSLMDKAIADKFFKEKRFKEDKSKEKHKSEADVIQMFYEGEKSDTLPKRVIPFYSPGDTITGKVHLTLSKPVKAERLVVGIQGQALISIRVYHQRGYWDDVTKEKYVKEKKDLWRTTTGNNDGGGLSDTMALLNVSDDEGVARSEVLAAGEHCYSFQFVLPEDVRQSVSPMVISSHNKGHIMYRIKAAIDQGKCYGGGNIVAHKGFWVRTPLDIAADPKNLESVTVEETLNTGVVTFWKSGKITVRATLQRVGFMLGETIQLSLEIHNESKGDIKEVTACIRLHGKARSSEAKTALSTGIDLKSVKAREGPVAANDQSTVYIMILPWDFNESSVDGNLLPVGMLEDCKILDVKYEVQVKLKRKGAHRNMEFGIPIVVGNQNTQSA